MTTLVKVRILSLVGTMLIHQREELSVIERNAYSCFHPTWKPASHAIIGSNVTNYIMGPYVFVAMGAT